MIPRVATLGIIQASSAVKHNPDRQFLCLSQESSAFTSVNAREFFTAQTRRGWIPVTRTGMRVEMAVGAKAKN
jgi:hypothetical protein